MDPARPRILVVDDEPRALELLVRSLRRVGEIVTAASGDEALPLLAEKRFELVISDERMPGMSGVELLSRIAERDENVGRILLTGYTDLVTSVDAINRGRVHAYLHKPTSPPDLVATVTAVLQRVGLARENQRLLSVVAEQNAQLEEALESLRGAQEKLVSSERMAAIGRMGAMIVHDLRGPLTAISTGLKLLREQAGGHGALGEAVIQTTDTSGRAVRKMLGLVDSLLDIAKFENGVMVLEREPVLFPLVSRGVIEEYAPLAEDLKIALRADLPDDLPALYVDEEKVERVLLNLVDNAMKFAPANGQVVVRAATIPVAKGAGPMVQVMVEDDGPGIPDADKERLFNRFAQLDSRQGRRRGTGLGLAFCKLAVEAHGGQIWVEDAPGRGTRFIFTLPAVDVPEWELFDD